LKDSSGVSIAGASEHPKAHVTLANGGRKEPPLLTPQVARGGTNAPATLSVRNGERERVGGPPAIGNGGIQPGWAVGSIRETHRTLLDPLPTIHPG